MIDQTIFDVIIDNIKHNKSIANSCKEQHVSTDSFWRDIDSFPNRLNDYARAKEQQIENLLDDIRDMEEQMQAEIRTCEPKIANAVATGYKVRIDNLKWIASKLKPKKYGERLAVDQDTSLRVTITNGQGEQVKV